MAKSEFRPTRYPVEHVEAVKKGAPAHMGYACATDMAGIKGDVVIMAHDEKALTAAFKKITGNEIDERGIHRVVIMKASAVRIDDDI